MSDKPHDDYVSFMTNDGLIAIRRSERDIIVGQMQSQLGIVDLHNEIVLLKERVAFLEGYIGASGRLVIKDSEPTGEIKYDNLG